MGLTYGSQNLMALWQLYWETVPCVHVCDLNVVSRNMCVCVIFIANCGCLSPDLTPLPYSNGALPWDVWISWCRIDWCALALSTLCSLSLFYRRNNIIRLFNTLSNISGFMPKISAIKSQSCANTAQNIPVVMAGDPRFLDVNMWQTFYWMSFEISRQKKKKKY